MQEIYNSFLIETREILDLLDIDLVELENNPDDAELLNKIFRSFHTIKGTAGFLGLTKLQKVTHCGEDLLNKLRKGEMTVNEAIMDAILKAFDSIAGLVNVIESQKTEDFDTEEAITLLTNVLDGNFEVVTKKEKSTEPENESIEIEDEEIVEIDEQIEEIQIEKIEIPQQKQMVAQPKQQDNSAKKVENTIRVDVERLDELLNFVSELVLGRNMLAQINSEVTNELEGTKIARNLAEATRQVDLMTTELQLSVMKTRMIKIGKVFNKFPRVVRDLAKETGKNIQLIIKGEETELDKTLIEEINDPLVHLIRNSADHGIEKPADRKKIGKNEKGTITLAAEHEGNNIIISIEDDGKGIDPDKIRDKAISKGLITPERAKELSRQEILGLIFLPGFSTAEVVTNVSGRGVGMDVVKTNVTKLRGIINIESEVNVGSKIIIKLPLTLAIIHGLLVQIGTEIVVIPLNSVIEIVRVTKKAIYTINQNEVIKLRENVLPLISIDELLYHNVRDYSKVQQQYIVIVAIAEKKFGIKVDDLLGQKEVVIKSLGNYLGTVSGIAGSTIMGDGKIVMIADIAELVNKITDKN